MYGGGETPLSLQLDGVEENDTTMATKLIKEHIDKTQILTIQGVLNTDEPFRQHKHSTAKAQQVTPTMEKLDRTSCKLADQEWKL